MILAEVKLPHAPEAETTALGCILLDSRSLDDLGALSADSFMSPHHGTIYETVAKMFADGAHIDLLTVGRELEQRGTLEEIGGRIYLAQLLNGVATAAAAGAVGNILRDAQERRSVIEACREAIELAAVPTSSLTDIRAIMATTAEMRRNVGDYARIGEGIPAILQDMEDASHNIKKQGVVPTGFQRLDAMLDGGLHPQSVYYIAARPSKGKSALAQSIANYAAATTGPVGVFSLEMPTKLAARRALAIRGNILHSDISRGTMNAAKFHDFSNAAEWVSQAKIYVCDRGGIRIEELCRIARRMHSREGIALLVIDYLQLITSNLGRSQTRENQVSMISGALKQLAMQLDIPLLVLSQLNRLADGVKPKLSHLRESGSIEQDADVVMMIHPAQVQGDETALIVPKNRNGAIGEIAMEWTPETTTFRERGIANDMIPEDM